MRKITEKCVDFGRVGLVLLALAALFVTSLPFVDHLRAMEPKETEGVIAEQVLPAGPVQLESSLDRTEPVADPAHASENMTPKSKPNCDPQATFVSITIVKLNDGSDRQDMELSQVVESNLHPNCPVSGLFVQTCCAQIGSDLARQFTLVGARPSGTS